jgi:hypothetical protein
MLRDIINKYSAQACRYGTDKGTVHSYTDVYEVIFEGKQNEHLIITEIGVAGGFSIQCWLEYFKNSKIYAVDINWSECEFTNWPEDKVIRLNADATKTETAELIEPSDIIIDDGSHLIQDQIASFNLLYPKMNTGGIYIIEDVTDLVTLLLAIDKYTATYQVYDRRPIKNRFDDILVVVYK